jgi:hypothetical protein
MSEIEGATAQEEHKHHRYVGSRIPWYVRMIWVLFWIFAVYYTIQYLFPDLRAGLLPPS